MHHWMRHTQIMLDLDYGRFPLALMWALPEVMQEGGAVITEIHVRITFVFYSFPPLVSFLFLFVFVEFHPGASFSMLLKFCVCIQ